MRRVLEPELMEDPAQIRAYAEADFDEPNSNFVSFFRQCVDETGFSGLILDLGCGPGDISIRLAQTFPSCQVHAVDGSAEMLDYGRKAVMALPGVGRRMKFIKGLIPDAVLPFSCYAAIVSNSLLHHLPDPQALWSTVKGFGAPGTTVLIMDLIRPHSEDQARAYVQSYAADEPEILKRDFYNSLLAAFTLEEIQLQLKDTGLTQLRVARASDRHVTISGALR